MAISALLLDIIASQICLRSMESLRLEAVFHLAGLWR
jgi:hypothetical protein